MEVTGGIDLTELEKIIKNMNKFEQKLRTKKINKATRKSANVVKKEAVRRAKEIDDPSTPEAIYRNISTRKKRTRNKNFSMYSVGVRGGAKKDSGLKFGPGGDTYYWRFVEFGTSKQGATPFLRPAIETKQQEVHNMFFKTLKEEFDK